MNRKFSTLLAIAVSVCILAAPAFARDSAQAATQPDKRAAAYYNFSMGHIYAELAANNNYRGEYVDKAIEHYKAALQADPNASSVNEELTDLYIQAGKLADAVTEAEDMLKRNPDNLEARRMLGRIYARLIQDGNSSKPNEERMRQAIEQFQKVVEKDPKDAESWLMLGRLYKFAQDAPNSEKAYKKALEADSDNELALSGLLGLYSDLGDAKSAADMARRLVDQNPNPRTLAMLARAYEEAQDYKSASETLKRLAEMTPGEPDVKKNLAEDMTMAGELDGALKLYQEIGEADPKDYLPPLRISQIYRQKHDFVQARAALERALANDPRNLDVRFAEVNLLEAEGKYPDAITRLKSILDTTAKPSYSASERQTRVKLLGELAGLYRANEQYVPAVETFRLIAGIDPTSAGGATADVIDTYRQAKDYPAAEKEAAAAAQKFPTDRAIKGARAMLLADLGRGEEGAAVAKQLLNGKNDRETYLLLAQVYDKSKKYPEMAQALDSAEKASDTDDKKLGVYFMRGAMYEKNQKVDLAEKEFRKVLEIDPQNAGALNYIGYMLADRNMRLAEADKLVRRALELEPNNGAYLDSLGWVCYKMGKLDEAETYLRQALERSSRDATVHDPMGDVYAQKGRLKEAIAQWEISLREWDAGAKSEVDPVEVAKIQKKLENARVRLAKDSGATAPVR